MSKHSKKITQVIVLILCLLCLAGCGALKIYADREKYPYIDKVSVATEDKAIVVQWEAPLFGNVNKVRIVISGNDRLEEFILPAHIGRYSYTGGEPGTVYRVYVTGKYNDGSYGEILSYDRMFLDFDNMPDIPFITLTTTDGTDPSYSIAKKPEDMWGASITDNDYVSGFFSMEEKGHGVKSAKMEIKVRGNTSAIITDKKPYRINLKNPLDLMNMGDEYADKDWILLNVGTDLNAYIGTYVAEYCGMEWQPHMRFVNVMLNGDYKGLYMLTETIERDEKKCDVGRDGYIFENDGYWWNADGVYFKTDKQMDPLGYTVSYPDIDDPADARMKKLQTYMQNIEDLFEAGDAEVFNYIDEESFAAWTLIKDILGVADYGGSNMIFNIYAIDDENPAKYQLKMGPVWDFDSAFMMDIDYWSWQHYWEGNFSNYLWSHPEFRDAYAAIWSSISDNICDDVTVYLNGLYIEKGDAIDMSRQFDSQRWRNNSRTLGSEIMQINEWFSRRKQWIDSKYD